MSKKDFMRGVEANAKANEAFMRKQAAATEELGKRVIQKIDEQGEIIDVVLDTLNSIEKRELYNLQSEYDIADLGENEKEVLASYLLTLIAKYDQNTEVQKEYYFSVKKHLGVTDVSSAMDLSLVENVDSRVELKAMFQTVCEFLFLKNGDSSFLDEFEDELDCFGLTRKAVREIIESIENIYDVLGLRGIVEHYIPATTKEEQETEETTGVAGDLTQETVIRSFTVHQGETKRYVSKELAIGTTITVEGELIFENCVVDLLHLSQIARIVVEDDAVLQFKNCEVRFPQLEKKDNLVISGRENTTILFESSNVYLKTKAIFTYGSLLFQNSQIIDPEVLCITVFNGEQNAVLIADSCITFDNAPSFEKTDLGAKTIFELKPSSTSIVRNTKISINRDSELSSTTKKEEKKTKSEFSSYSAIRTAATNSAFARVYSALSSKAGIFASSALDEESALKFIDCEFVNIHNNLYDKNSFWADAYGFSGCRFINCGKDLLNGLDYVENCEFVMEAGETSTTSVTEQKSFEMMVSSVKKMRGALILSGEILEGTIAMGDTVILPKKKKAVKVSAITVADKMLSEAVKGDEVSLMINGITENDVGVFDLICGE